MFFSEVLFFDISLSFWEGGVLSLLPTSSFFSVYLSIFSFSLSLLGMHVLIGKVVYHVVAVVARSLVQRYSTG